MSVVCGVCGKKAVVRAKILVEGVLELFVEAKVDRAEHHLPKHIDRKA
jgi:hypothetical protein